MSLLFLRGRHHSWEVGWAFNISIYPQSSCAPESSNQQTPATTPTSAMIPPTSQSAPVISCGPNRLRPLSMPSAETASVFGFGLFWVFLLFFFLGFLSCSVEARPAHPQTPLLGNGVTIHSMVPTNLLSLFLPHAHLSSYTPLKKFLRLPARRSQWFCCLFLVAYSVLHLQ